MKRSPIRPTMIVLCVLLTASMCFAAPDGIYKSSSPATNAYVQTYAGTTPPMVVIITPDLNEWHVFLDSDYRDGVDVAGLSNPQEHLKMTFQGDTAAQATLTFADGSSQTYSFTRQFAAPDTGHSGDGIYKPDPITTNLYLQFYADEHSMIAIFTPDLKEFHVFQDTDYRDGIDASSLRAGEQDRLVMTPHADGSLTASILYGDGTRQDWTLFPAFASPYVPSQDYGTLNGNVFDLNGNPVPDVRVTAGNATTKTNEQGFFTLSSLIPSSRQLVGFSKSNYVTTYRVTPIFANEVAFIEINMAPVKKTATIPGDTGGTVTTDTGGSVAIPANALIEEQGGSMNRAVGEETYSGQVEVNLTDFDPTDSREINAFPGDFEGVRMDGTTIDPFRSFGFMDISLYTSNGVPLQLASGKTAEIEIPIPEDLRASAPDTIPLWFFDTTDGQWHEVGTLTKTGDKYKASITHFSTWNCDDIYNTCTLKGRVVDSDSNPVAGARITVTGNGWTRRTTTNSEGRFSVRVEANATITYWASKGTLKTTPVTTTSCPPGGENDVGDIVLDTIPVTITLTWGAAPEDLDAHLSVPLPDGGRQHVYYPDSGTRVADVKLDTDDTTSYGPEIFSIFVLHDGTYRYSVHQFSEDSTIAASGAVVQVVIEGEGTFTYTPPQSGAEGEDDVWRVFDLTYNAATKEVSITPIGDYLHNIPAGDDASFAP